MLAIDAPVFLLGMPRSGTTWLSQIFESAPEAIVRLSPPYSFEFRGKLNVNSSRSDWLKVLQGAVNSNDRFLTQNWRRDSGELETFSKNFDEVTTLFVKDTRYHDLYLSAIKRLPRSKFIYIVRHPAAALWSWKSCKEFPEYADFRREWRSGACRKREGDQEYWGFDDWLALTHRYRILSSVHPDRVFIVKYEQLVKDAEAETKRMFNFCGISLGSQTLSFLKRSQQRNDPRPYAVFKDKAHHARWRQLFPQNLMDEIERDTIKQGLKDYLA